MSNLDGYGPSWTKKQNKAEGMTVKIEELQRHYLVPTIPNKLSF